VSEDTVVKGVIAIVVFVPALIILAAWTFNLEGELKYLAILVLAFAAYVIFDQGKKLIAEIKKK